MDAIFVFNELFHQLTLILPRVLDIAILSNQRTMMFPSSKTISEMVTQKLITWFQKIHMYCLDFRIRLEVLLIYIITVSQIREGLRTNTLTTDTFCICLSQVRNLESSCCRLLIISYLCFVYCFVHEQARLNCFTFVVSDP